VKTNWRHRASSQSTRNARTWSIGTRRPQSRLLPCTGSQQELLPRIETRSSRGRVQRSRATANCKRKNGGSVAVGERGCGSCKGTEKNSQAFATAYPARPETRAAAGNCAGSDADCSVAEARLRVLLAQEKSPVFVRMFKDELKNSLTFHSALLEEGGEKERASSLRSEAKKL
jgi:hypothetical protein